MLKYDDEKGFHKPGLYREPNYPLSYFEEELERKDSMMLSSMKKYIFLPVIRIVLVFLFVPWLLTAGTTFGLIACVSLSFYFFVRYGELSEENNTSASSLMMNIIFLPLVLYRKYIVDEKQQ